MLKGSKYILIFSKPLAEIQFEALLNIFQMTYWYP